ncbi:MAG: aminotransferase class V-fold PLP-dependent enzyme, partial [Treponema sp.]|nr:aminotransferase class V-fold PLP-dependent enzyme [Treponema sp.]
IYFTSGGTESNAIVIHSNLLRKRNARILASKVEHPSIRENTAMLEKLEKQIGFIPVDGAGRVSAELLSKTLEKYTDARFAAIMAVNNETGAVMDMPALSSVLRKNSASAETAHAPIHLHSDLVQAIGKIPVAITGWDLDSASFSAHKLGGPRGTGLLYLKHPLESIFAGGHQERRIRPGTENTAGALALAACLEQHALSETVSAEYARAERRFKQLLCSLKSMSRCTLIPQDRQAEDKRFSPYIVQAAFDGIPGEVMVRALDDSGFAVSTGSACSSSSPERPVLAAMGIDSKQRLEGIRISQGWSTTDEEIELLVAAINEVLKFL